MEKTRVILKIVFFVIAVVATALNQQEVFSGNTAKIVASVAMVANAMFGLLDKTVSNWISDSNIKFLSSDFDTIKQADDKQ